MKYSLESIKGLLQEVIELCIAITFFSMVLRKVELTTFETTIMVIGFISVVLKYIILTILKLKKEVN